jgi:hypothetical protein
VDVGQDGQPGPFADLFEDAQPFIHAKPAKRLVRSAVRLVEGALENQEQVQLVGNGGQAFGHAQGKMFVFDHTGAGDCEKPRISTDVAFTKPHEEFRHLSKAGTEPPVSDIN